MSNRPTVVSGGCARMYNHGQNDIDLLPRAIYSVASHDENGTVCSLYACKGKRTYITCKCIEPFVDH